MKRLLCLAVVAAFVAGLSLSHMAMGARKAPKVDICHVTASTRLDEGGTLYIGHVVNVSDNAVHAHLQHGDSLRFVDIDSLASPAQPDPLSWREVAELNGLHTGGCNCAVPYPVEPKS